MTETIADIPIPPRSILDAYEPTFEPADELEAWIRQTFIDDGAELMNAEHEHLRLATIGMLWASVPYVKKHRRVLGEARIGEPTGSNAWSVGRTEQQLREWFGQIPDFLITLDAPWFAQASNLARCAMIEHELFHAAQQRDEFGAPKFSRSTGRPMWCIASHDIEEFTAVVRRYGAWSDELDEMRRVMSAGPTIGKAEIDGICGSCMRKAA